MLLSTYHLERSKTMNGLIRKISIGRDYKNEAMHYSVGQEVYGGHTIESIVEEQDRLVFILRKTTKQYLGKTLTKTWV